MYADFAWIMHGYTLPGGVPFGSKNFARKDNIFALESQDMPQEIRKKDYNDGHIASSSRVFTGMEEYTKFTGGSFGKVDPPSGGPTQYDRVFDDWRESPAYEELIDVFRQGGAAVVIDVKLVIREYTVSPMAPPKLTIESLEGLKALEDNGLNSDEGYKAIQAYEAFADKFGTHFASTMWSGAAAQWIVMFSQTDRLQNSNESLIRSAAYYAGKETPYLPGYQQAKQGHTWNYPVPLQSLTISAGALPRDTLKGWLQDVKSKPVPVFRKFSLLSELINPASASSMRERAQRHGINLQFDAEKMSRWMAKKYREAKHRNVRVSPKMLILAHLLVF